MSKIDIRFRRQQFTQGRIQRHKNYESLLDRHRKSHRRKIRGVVLLAFILILAIVLVVSFFYKANATTIEKEIPNQEVNLSGPGSMDFN